MAPRRPIAIDQRLSLVPSVADGPLETAHQQFERDTPSAQACPFKAAQYLFQAPLGFAGYNPLLLFPIHGPTAARDFPTRLLRNSDSRLSKFLGLLRDKTSVL
ncbi:hypothetical protein K0M31_019871 [Melipona bicolor]|uniref:Uncharacterized protein n=1 Tax=Melipona bicolor TaxID=60889 RepID=A0AA40G0H8_9HYME|nr:hypothetical protein K0M31_019871 [Melipona bicolor]